MKESTAILVGFGAASLVPAALISIAWPLNGVHDIGGIIGSFGVFYPFSAIFTLLLGFPAFLLLRRFAPGRWWSVSIVGFLLGSIAAIVLRLPSVPNPHDFTKFGPIGALSALIFWAIYRRTAATAAPDTQ